MAFILLHCQNLETRNVPTSDDRLYCLLKRAGELFLMFSPCVQHVTYKAANNHVFLLQARKYVMDSMGVKYAEGVILDLEETWKESDPRTPLICFLSMGSDPTGSIIALGKKLKVETRYVSMGQGQEIHARKLMQQTMANVSEDREAPAIFVQFLYSSS